MYSYELLEDCPIEELYQTFLKAFSDYAVQMQPSFEEYQTMLKRRGFEGSVSVGARKEPEKELVGFILNGKRKIGKEQTIYDVMTGIVPAWRKQGVSKGMFQFIEQVLAKEEIEVYLLEVLQENHTAFDLYRKQGFKISRNYDVFQLQKPIAFQSNSAIVIQVVPELSRNEWLQVERFWDMFPSWQNSIASIQAAAESFDYVLAFKEENLIGYGIIDSKTGDIPQFGISREHRRNGIGNLLFSVLSEKNAADKLSVVNIESDQIGTKLFLEQLGFQLTTSQYEMKRVLK